MKLGRPLGGDLRHLVVALFLPVALLLPSRVSALDVQGTVQFQGAVSFSAPVAGIALQDVAVRPDTDTEPTGNGAKCSMLSVSADNADAGGTYPDLGTVSAEILIEKGGPNLPEGGCLVTLHASAWDGAAATVRGSQTALVDVATVQSDGTVELDDLVVRESQAVAGIDTDCLKWVKKQSKFRDKCNALILKKGPETAALKCKEANPVPIGCDPGLHVEALLALAHGMNDQQVNPASGEAVDFAEVGDGAKCQKRIGKAAQKYLTKRLLLVQKKCVQKNLDSVVCRSEQSQISKRKLDVIDRCTDVVLIDTGTGRLLPDVGTPCDQCIEAGVMDRKCLKSCLGATLDSLVDGIVGDVPVCGDGILQGGEFCDDGNLDNGDGCSDVCAVEP